MLKDITLGQYYPADSFVHALDPRVKIILTMVFIVAVFLGSSLWAMIPIILFILLAARTARVPVKLLFKGLKPLRIILIFTFVLNLLFTAGETVILEFWKIRITQESLMNAIRFSSRLVFLVTGASLLTLTTQPVVLTDGMERLLSPLKKIGFPAHELAMMMSIALRFIPTLLEEADKIMKAQMARGADFESGNLLQRARAMVPLLVPLFVSAFRRAGDLAMAMEARCYHGGEGRTRLRILKITRKDVIACLALAVLTAIVAVL